MTNIKNHGLVISSTRRNPSASLAQWSLQPVVYVVFLKSVFKAWTCSSRQAGISQHNNGTLLPFFTRVRSNCQILPHDVYHWDKKIIHRKDNSTALWFLNWSHSELLQPWCYPVYQSAFHQILSRTIVIKKVVAKCTKKATTRSKMISCKCLDGTYRYCIYWKTTACSVFNFFLTILRQLLKIMV